MGRPHKGSRTHSKFRSHLVCYNQLCQPLPDFLCVSPYFRSIYMYICMPPFACSRFDHAHNVEQERFRPARNSNLHSLPKTSIIHVRTYLRCTFASSISFSPSVRDSSLNSVGHLRAVRTRSPLRSGTALVCRVSSPAVSATLFSQMP